MKSATRLLLALLLGVPQAAFAAYTETNGAPVVEQAAVRTWAETFTTTLGDGSTLDVTQCFSTPLVSFDASTGDTSADATIQTFSCETATQSTGLCDEIQRQPNASGTVPSQFTDVQMPVQGGFFRYVKRSATAGGDTAQVTVKCSIASVGAVAADAADLTYDPLERLDWLDPDPSDLATAADKLAADKQDIADSSAVTEGSASPEGLDNCNAPQCLKFQTGSTPDALWATPSTGTGAWFPIGGFDDDTGYMRPFVTSKGIYVGTGADPTTDAGCRINVSTGSMFCTNGFAFPVTVPKWWTVRLAGTTNTAGELDSADGVCIPGTGGVIPRFNNAGSDHIVCGIPIPEGHAVHFGTTYLRLDQVANLTTTDSVEIKLFGCLSTHIDLDDCTALATYGTVNASSVAKTAVFSPNLAALGEIAADTYDLFVIGSEPTTVLDGTDDGLVAFSGFIELIHGTDLPSFTQ